MFEIRESGGPEPAGNAGGDAGGDAGGVVLDAAALAGWVARLAGLGRDVTDAERVDQIRELERVKAAAAAAQARATADLDASQRAAQAAAGVRPGDLGKGVAGQVALARRESPVRGGQHLGLAKALVSEMPHTLAALTAGRLSEWRATLLVRETACLTREHRRLVDAELAGDPATLDGLGDKALAAAARKVAYRLDPHAALRRARRAHTERRVTCRPAPDTMAYLTALLPVREAVAAYAALTRAADTARAAGDGRGRGQVMADTLVARLTGQATADAVPVEIALVITDRTLLAGDDEPAHLPGYGPIPAPLARDWATPTGTPGAGHPGVDAWIRRLYTHPATGDLIAQDSTRRTFPPAARRFVRTRDQDTCRTPWCDAPARHTDHARAHAAGGPTTTGNAQDLCEACNYTKQAPGWHAEPTPGPRHTVTTTTPTGHTYHSTAPPPPGTPKPRPGPTRIEYHFTHLLRAA